MKGFLMKDNKNIEQLLLDDISSEDLLNSKIEQEFTSQLEDKGCREKKFVTDLKLAPKEKLFSKDAVYLVINKNSKTKSYINGVQAEGFLGSQNAPREKFLSSKTDYFVSDSNFIKFFKVKVQLNV